LARTPFAPGAPALAGAARVVDEVLSRGRSLDGVLERGAAGAQRAAVRAVASGTVRWYLRLMPALQPLLSRPRDLDGPVRALLACAAHQIVYSRHAPEATVHGAVDASRILKKAAASGLVNAVLRRFVTERGRLLARVDAEPAGRTAHPAWLAAELARHWPGQVESILEADNAHPPMVLRVDLSRTTRAACLGSLAAEGIDAREVQWIKSAIVLEHPRAVSDIPGFAQGLLSVQDAGAQLAATLLRAKPGQRVLDACAAPGGKTGHLLEEGGGALEVVAADVSGERLALVEENLRRLGRSAQLKVADLRDPQALAGEAPFDRILVDAPCSSTGVIRRHPDIKLLRRSCDTAAFAATQAAILRNAAVRLAPGGRLVYSTCSLLPAENEQVMAGLLEELPHLRVAEAPRGGELAPGGIARSIGTQLLPGAEAGTDGFYYACLENTTAGT